MPKGDHSMKYGRIGWLVVMLLVGLLAGCAGGGNAPVVDRQHGKSAPVARAGKPATGSYVVRPKDTLYSIAFRFGHDWKALAARNGIAAPYTIRPGQVIQLSGTARKVAAKPVAAKPASKPVVQSKPAARQPAQTAAKPAAKPATKPAAKPAPAAPKPKSAPKPSGNWLWPAEGTLISRFSSATNLNKGIDIAGQSGQPVRASAKGSVVYAGSDLRGYGNLLIIKHDDVFISAYGHNRRLLVSEGQQVKAGQQIAEMGSTGTDRVKLHFEIRRQGTPVDPLQYLPAR